MEDFQALETALSRGMRRLQGDWVLKRSNYEKEFVRRMGRNWSLLNRRDYDCSFKNRSMRYPIKVELKKCQRHIWLDLLRYTAKASAETRRNVTLILLYDRNDPVVSDYILVPTAVLQARLFDRFPSVRSIKRLENLKQYVPRQINALVNLTRNDLYELSENFNENTRVVQT